MYIIRSAFFLLLLFFSVFTNGQKFNISFAPETSTQAFTGNIFLYLSKDNKNPKEGKVDRVLFPCYRIAVKDIKPGQTVTFDDAALSFPVVLSEIERGNYYIQAVWDKNLGGRSIGNSPGNIYNNAIKANLTKNGNEVFNIVCSEVIKEQSFTETKFRKELKAPSELLSRFYKRSTTINAAILLPKEYYDHPQRKFPVLFEIIGYGGDYHNFSGSNEPSTPIDTTPCIRVILDGNYSQGHSEYANSENNGPWSDALTTELIPAIEKKFRCDAAKLLTGHSSGGWAALWLQTRYPTMFIAAWVRSPDPVDFQNFHGVDLYSEKNLFFNKDSALRMVATVAGRIPWASMKLAYGLENIISRGEQMHSYNAVFSGKATNGNPRTICDPLTGEIDSITANHWKAYDICLFLRTNWSLLQPYLQDKALVTVGNNDNFFSNKSVQLLEEEMKKLNSGFIFTYFSGDHFTLTSPEYFQLGYRFLQQKYNEFITRPKSSNAK